MEAKGSDGPRPKCHQYKFWVVLFESLKHNNFEKVIVLIRILRCLDIIRLKEQDQARIRLMETWRLLS